MDSVTALWNRYFDGVEEIALRLKDIKGVLSVFNANIDAVKEVNENSFLEWIDKAEVTIEDIDAVNCKEISSKAAFFNGLLDCFSRGIAQEWLITDITLFKWLQEVVGYDSYQMGGQGGIIANVLSLGDISKVLVHAASLPKEQAQLFLDRENLLSANSEDELVKAKSAERENDTPLIHWILEFKKGDTIRIGGTSYSCPKSNRFIATWDPLNFKLAIDPHFVQAVNNYSGTLQYCLLAGYQMLTEPLASGDSALVRIQQSKEVVRHWREQHPEMVVHFEFASTQDAQVRKFLIDEMGGWADSLGLNEQELIDLLEITDNDALAKECRESTHAVELFKGLTEIFIHTGVKRIQLHMFGLYITLLRSTDKALAVSAREGMLLAATVAASKAGKGSLEISEDLLWEAREKCGNVYLEEFEALTAYIIESYNAKSFEETGIYIGDEYTIVAIPTKIIEKPVSLVGMGDTISSLSLVGSH